MRKFLVVAFAGIVLLGSSSVAQGARGIFGSAIGLKSNIFNSGQNTFFQTSLLGDSRHQPVASSSVTLPVVQDSAGEFNKNRTDPTRRSLGTFDTGAGDTLVLIGGGVLTFKNGGSDVTGAFLHYRIDGGAFEVISLPFNENLSGGNAGDQRWASTASNIDLLSGLGNGTYNLEWYYQITSNEGDVWDNRDGSNYNATFTVVPEPSTYVAGALSLFALGFAQRRRLKSFFGARQPLT